MEKEKKDLLVFGYGLALIIPYLIFMRSLSLEKNTVSLFVVLGGFAFVLWLTVRMTRLNPTINLWVLLVQFGILWRLMEVKTSWPPYVFLIITMGVIMTTVVDVQRLQPLYNGWMKVAYFIGTLLNKFILTLVYYLVFTPLGLFFRITGKDHLNRKLDPKAKTYWSTRPNREFKKENYAKQF